MSRRKTKPEEIRNTANYFSKYITMENKRNEIDTTNTTESTCRWNR